MRPKLVLAAFLIVAMVVVAGCPQSTEKAAGPVKVCTSAGGSCLFDEGKLGLCVAKTELCNSLPCFTCQSQH